MDIGIQFDPAKFEGWEFVGIPSNLEDWCRLYWRPTEKEFNADGKNGFKFVSFLLVTHGNDSNPFADKSSWVEPFIHGVAFFDGVRHLYFGSQKTENEGYFNYPKWAQIEAVITKIKELELKYCDPEQLSSHGK